MMQIMRDLTPTARVFCSDGYDAAVAYLADILPFEVHGFTNQEPHNGWVIPPHWDVREAKIYEAESGRLVYDGLWHPLAVIALSAGFEGTVSRDELRRHLHVHPHDPQAIPFHFRQQYRSWERDWGFCVPRTLYDSLLPGNYRVVLQVVESEGTLKILDYTHAGATDNTFVFVAHLDHPGMANDDLAGCTVGVELLRRLSQQKTKFSYKLLLVQEIMGSEYYLSSLPQSARQQLLEGIFLEMLGTRTDFGLQASIKSDSHLEALLGDVLRERGIPHRRAGFKEIISNDEYVFEAYGIPMASLSRFPYPEYHSDRDNVSIIDPERMEEAVSVLWETVMRLEATHLVRKKVSGVLCLSHPDYDLYAEPGQPSLNPAESSDALKFKILMDLIPTLQRPVTTQSLASRVGLPEERVLGYLRRWADRKLIDLI